MSKASSRFIVIQCKGKNWSGDRVFYFDHEFQLKELMMEIKNTENIVFDESQMIEWMLSFAELSGHLIVFYKGNKLHGTPLVKIFEGGLLPEEYRPYNAGASLESRPIIYN